MKKQVPTLEEFHEMRRIYYKESTMLFFDIMDEFNIDESGDFCVWWNNSSDGEDGEVEAFLKRYSKLGKLLSDIDTEQETSYTDNKENDT